MEILYNCFHGSEELVVNNSLDGTLKQFQKLHKSISLTSCIGQIVPPFSVKRHLQLSLSGEEQKKNNQIICRQINIFVLVGTHALMHASPTTRPLAQASRMP